MHVFYICLTIETILFFLNIDGNMHFKFTFWKKYNFIQPFGYIFKFYV